MAISFPTSPLTNDTYTVGTKTWVYNGYAWDLVVGDVTSAYNTANAAYDKANSANVLAYNTGIGANAWANSLATAGNNYTNSVGIAGNNYTNSVGIAGNNYTNSVGIAGNNYTISIGASSNAWTNAVGTAGNNYTISVGAAANNWANTKLSNTDNVVFNGSLQIANTLYAKDIVISNTMIANISGNINTLYIQNDITHVNSIFFATNSISSANGLVVAGQVTWNPDELTLDVGTGQSILQLGQEQYVRILNQSGETIYNANAVAYVGTTGASGKILGARAIANNSYDSKNILGIATQDIPNGEEGFVTTFGKIRKIDTSMFSAGDVLYVSASIPGALQNTKPTAPNNKVQVGTVIYKSATVGSIFCAVQRGSSLADDEFVNFTSISNGDMIMYVSANGRFENRPQSSINAGLLDGYDTSSANVPNTVVVRDQWGNFSAGNITCSLSNTGTIDMRLTSDPGQVEGRIWYDGTLDHALNYYTDITGVSVAMGRQQVFRVRNATANTYTVGQAVYATGGSVSKVPDIDLAIANDLTKSQVIGVIFGSNIGPNSFGYIMSMGTYVHGDTTVYGVEGTRLYLSPTTAGALQNTMPPAPYHPVQIGIVTYQNNAQGTILISSIQRLTGLNLANGSIGFLVDGTQGRVADDHANLRYDTGNTTLWVNRVNTGILFVDGINVQPSFTAVNNYTVSVGAAGNNYTDSVGAAANNHANTTYLKLSGGTITGDLSITGNVFLLGNTTSISTNNLIVNDSLIYLAANNDLSDIVDIGFVGHYSNGTANLHTGLFRDHASKEYFLFSEMDGPEPELINDLVPYANGMINAALHADLITSNLNLGGANAIVWITDAYNKANAANVLAYNTGIGANAYASAVGVSANLYATSVGAAANNASIARDTAGNNYTNSVGIAGNNYTVSVGASSNAWSNAVGTAGNNYTVSVGATSNTWANTVGTAGNNYTNSVGAAANNASIARDTAGNNYTNSVGAAANNWANTKVAAVTSNSSSRIWANTSIDGNNNENVYLDLSTSGVTATTYGGTTQIPSFTVDAYGRVTFAANNAFTGGGLSVTDEVTSASTYYPTLSLVTTGSVSVANTSSTKLYFVPSTGTLSATNFNSLSDIMLKTDIEDFDGVMLLDLINPVTFRWRDNGNRSYGVIAQNLEKKLPELVETGENGLKSVSYIPMIAMLIDVVKKQESSIKELKKEIEEIRNLLNR